MINDNEKYYYFAVKSKLELYSSEWLRSKKQSITNKDNCFQNALNDSLDYQRIKKYPQKISKRKPYNNQYNCIDVNQYISIKRLNRIIRKLPRIYYLYLIIRKK